MRRECNQCAEKMATIPFVVYEAALERKKRVIKRLWISLIVVTSILAASNAIWFVIK
jgi:hypothetical protein